MPELPEVETTVRDLRPHVVGRSFTWAEIGVPRMVRAPSPEAFTRGLIGRRIVAADRRGKFLVFPLDQGAFVVHLMMGGALLWVQPEPAGVPLSMAGEPVRSGHATAGERQEDAVRVAGGPDLPDLLPAVAKPAPAGWRVPAAEAREVPWMGRDPARYTRLRFGLDDGSQLWLVNPRTLGGVWLVDDPEQVVGHLGPEPLDPSFTAARFAQRLKGRSAPIKPLLLSQEVVAGIGNIYADEALFLARIRPERPADELTPAEVRRLHKAVVAALNRGLEYRGTSLGDFVTPNGVAGQHQTALNVFRRQGSPCPRCGAPVQRIFFRGRGTHFCPKCQK